MSKKKIYTRQEFEKSRKQWAEKMSQNKFLKEKSLEVFVEADKHNWIHQTNWLGEPSLQTAEDLVTFQEIIFQTKPEYIIEVGVAWAGSLLLYATLMEALGGNKIIGVDVFMPDDLKERIYSHGKISERIKLIEGSSLEVHTLNQIKDILGNSKKVMVHLDSHHTHDHVLKELNLYSGFVDNGYYMVAGDTIIDYIPEQKHRPRPWGKGNNPKTALDEFLKSNNDFFIDPQFDQKRLMSNQPGGYLRCIRSNG